MSVTSFNKCRRYHAPYIYVEETGLSGCYFFNRDKLVKKKCSIEKDVAGVAKSPPTSTDGVPCNSLGARATTFLAFPVVDIADDVKDCGVLD
mmetsp:Transcript_21740/g.36587  ORF Transcript_21740/g.36587 Transcript_21740/m.36587 type:complete len:92 (+) Transcript_21740:2123-2398(+)